MGGGGNGAQLAQPQEAPQQPQGEVNGSQDGGQQHGGQPASLGGENGSQAGGVSGGNGEEPAAQGGQSGGHQQGGGEAPPGNPDVVGALFAQSNCLTYNKQLTRETCNTLCMCVVFMFFLSALSCKSLRHWLLSKKGLQPGNHA